MRKQKYMALLLCAVSIASFAGCTKKEVPITESSLAVNVQESKLSDNGQPEEATEAPAQEDSEKQTEESVAEEKPSKDIFMQEVPSNVSGDANLSTVSFLGDEYLIAGEDTADFWNPMG